MGCLPALKKQFSLSLLGLTPTPEEGSTRWHTSNFSWLNRGNNFLIFRALFTLYWTILTLTSLGYEESKKKMNGHWFIYVTYWTATLEMFYSWSSMYVAFKHRGEGPKQGALPGDMKTMWVLREMTMVSSLMVFLLYWGLVYDGCCTTAFTYQTHGANFIIALVDLTLCATPLRVLHVWMPAVYQFCFGLFSLVYYAADGKNEDGHPYIYEVLDWGDNAGGVVILLAILLIVASPVLHTLLCVWSYIFRSMADEVETPEGDHANIQYKQTEMV